MQVTIEDVSPVKKILHIEVPQETVAKELDAAYRQLKQNAKVKGFRPGKAPRSVLERVYGKDVNADVVSRLIQSSFSDAVKDNKIKMIGQPEIDPPEINKEKAYIYDATVEVTPEIDDLDYKGIELEKTLYNVSNEEIEMQLTMLQRNLARYEPIAEPRPAAENDFVMIDFTQQVQGEEADEKTENFTMKIGDQRIHSDVDAALVGMSPQETKTVAVTFDDENPNEDLSGKSVSYDLRLNEIREEILPPIDDEMAKKLGEYESLDALKERISENLQNGYDKRGEQEINEQIFTNLLEKTTFDVPESLVKYELDAMVNDMEQRLSQQNMSMDEAGLSPETIREKYRETAEKQVRRHLLLNKLIDQEELELSEEELDAGFAEMAETYGQPVEGIKGYYREFPDRLDMLKNALLEKKAIALIVENGQVTEVEPEPETDSEKDETVASE
jgi:trigger factor